MTTPTAYVTITKMDQGVLVKVGSESQTFDFNNYTKFRDEILNNKQQGSFLFITQGFILRSADVSDLKKLMKQKRYS